LSGQASLGSFQFPVLSVLVGSLGTTEKLSAEEPLAKGCHHAFRERKSSNTGKLELGNQPVCSSHFANFNLQFSICISLCIYDFAIRLEEGIYTVKL